MATHTIHLSEQQDLAIGCLAKVLNLTVPQTLESLIANAVTGIRREGRTEADFLRYCYGDEADEARQKYYAKGGE